MVRRRTSKFSVPHRAEVAIAVIVSALVLIVDLRDAIGFSSFGVLLYYLVANGSALTQSRNWRRYPKALQIVGAAGCLILVAALPVGSIVWGLVVLGVGAGGRLLRRSQKPQANTPGDGKRAT